MYIKTLKPVSSKDLLILSLLIKNNVVMRYFLCFSLIFPFGDQFERSQKYQLLDFFLRRAPTKFVLYFNSDSVYYFLLDTCGTVCASVMFVIFVHVSRLPTDSLWCCHHGCRNACAFFWLFFHQHSVYRFHHWKTCSKQVLRSCMSPMSSLQQLFPTWVLTGSFWLQEWQNW